MCKNLLYAMAYNLLYMLWHITCACTDIKDIALRYYGVICCYFVPKGVVRRSTGTRGSMEDLLDYEDSARMYRVFCFSITHRWCG